MTGKLLGLFILIPFFYSCELKNVGEGSLNNSDTICVGTYNLRIITPIDSGARSWVNRRHYIASTINNSSFEIMGFQEILNDVQLSDLKQVLPSYAFLSNGQDNSSGTKGEMLAIVYDKYRFQVLESGFFFLSPTPDFAGIGWDASTNRICQWAKIYDLFNQNEFYFFNTHFNWSGDVSRAAGAKLVTHMIDSLAIGTPVICVGDFNALTTEVAFYNQMTSNLTDSRNASVSSPTGSYGTFNNWNTSKTSFTKYKRIDYIFVSDFEVLSYETINEKFVVDAWPSDHFPVKVTLIMNKQVGLYPVL